MYNTENIIHRGDVDIHFSGESLEEKHHNMVMREQVVEEDCLDSFLPVYIDMIH